MKVVNVKWTEEGNLVQMECKKGTRFWHNTWESMAICQCCKEYAYWHRIDPAPDGLPFAEMCLEEVYAE